MKKMALLNKLLTCDDSLLSAVVWNETCLLSPGTGKFPDKIFINAHCAKI